MSGVFLRIANMSISAGYLILAVLRLILGRVPKNLLICILLDAERKFKENGWQVTYFGNFEQMGAMLNSVLG